MAASRFVDAGAERAPSGSGRPDPKGIPVVRRIPGTHTAILDRGLEPRPIPVARPKDKPHLRPAVHPQLVSQLASKSSIKSPQPGNERNIAPVLKAGRTDVKSQQAVENLKARDDTKVKEGPHPVESVEHKLVDPALSQALDKKVQGGGNNRWFNQVSTAPTARARLNSFSPQKGSIESPKG